MNTFFLSRLLVELCTPFILSISLLIAGTLFLIFNRTRIALLCNVCGLFILISCGYGVWFESAIKERERLYQPLAVNGVVPDGLEDIGYIVVLGSGHVSDPHLPVTSQIGGSSLYRVIECKRLSKILPQAHVIIMGGTGYDLVPNAEVVKEVALIIDISDDKITIENRPNNTLEEAEYLKNHVGLEPFILITSANHMKRAMSIFFRMGMQPIAAPTDYLYKDQQNKPASSILPHPNNLEVAKRLMYEYMGTLWIKAKEILRNSP